MKVRLHGGNIFSNENVHKLFKIFYEEKKVIEASCKEENLMGEEL